MMSQKIKLLVADTTAFINNVNLYEYAENILTVPDVINEVKSKRQIRRLVVLPFDLQVREPTKESITYVSNFAKSTGDYASLSGIDMKIIALTYELHIENEGTTNLRESPIIPTIILSKIKPKEMIDKTGLQDWKSLPESLPEMKNVENEDNSFSENNEFEVNNKLKTIESKIDDKNIVIELHKMNLDNNIEEIISDLTEICDVKNSNDEMGWITPKNIEDIKKNVNGEFVEKFPTVACMTTDYALQNVLKQINLQICALNGRLIKHLRTYILRCYSCFKTTSIMTRIFCSNCGNKTLKRVSISLDQNGKQLIHINTNRPLSVKYKNQSLPRPKGGKHSRNPLVVEDQPMPKQMPSRVAKSKTQAFNEDYTAGYSPFATRDLNSKSALLRSRGQIKEWARNNNFEEERRKKFYNRLVK